MLMVGDVIVHMDIITECFCCDLEVCKGECCVAGDAGAPVTLDEIAEIEQALPAVWGDLSASAQSVIDRQGVSYIDREGDLVTSIVNGQDCVFTCYNGDGDDRRVQALPSGCCMCALECAFRAGRTRWPKPISCYLYPIREKKTGQFTALSYHRWDVCHEAVSLGRQRGIPVYQFLRDPLIRRFGQEWYDELETVVTEMKKQNLI